MSKHRVSSLETDWYIHLKKKKKANKKAQSEDDIDTLFENLLGLLLWKWNFKYEAIDLVEESSEFRLLDTAQSYSEDYSEEMKGQWGV